MKPKGIRITLAKTGELIAEGRKGWAITRFEGNYYIPGKNLVSHGLRVNYVPGLCV